MLENKLQTFFYYQIQPKAPLFKSFTYKSKLKLKPGQRVKISFGKRQIHGWILGEKPVRLMEEKKIKEIVEWDQNSLALSEKRLNWMKWLSDYYHYPLGSILDLSFLKESFKKKTAVFEKAPSLNLQEGELLKLTKEQEDCVNQILKQPKFQTHLIHGVTGSGKTEIYIRLIAQTLKQSKQALVLLPEIFLTPQIVKRLEKIFGDQTALLHSQVSSANKKKSMEKLVVWSKKPISGNALGLILPFAPLRAYYYR